MIPLEILALCKNQSQRVLLILNGNCEVEGILADFDPACNFLLRDASSYRTVRAAAPGERDQREKTGEFVSMLVPSHSVEMIVPGGAQQNIVSTVADAPIGQ